MQLVIDRSKWTRGDNTQARLYDPRLDKFDALGFYLREMDIPLTWMAFATSPASVFGSPYGPSAPPEVEWLLDYSDRSQCSNLCSRIMATNDEPLIHDEKRESDLTHLFAEAGVEVTFV